MHHRWTIAFCCALVLLGSACATTRQQGPQRDRTAELRRLYGPHFIIENPRHQERYDAPDELWERVTELFDVKLPWTITVVLMESPHLGGAFTRRTVFLSTQKEGGYSEAVLAHEIAHFAIHEVTHAYPWPLDELFFNEGLAEYVEHWYAGDLDEYRRQAMETCARYAQTGRLGMQDLRAWRSFVWEPWAEGTGGKHSYRVAFSFADFLVEAYGFEAVLRALRQMTQREQEHGNTRRVTLERALEAQTGQDVRDLFAGWYDTLALDEK